MDNLSSEPREKNSKINSKQAKGKYNTGKSRNQWN